MRPAALAPADGPVGAVEPGSEFFNGIERPKGGGSQRILQAVPICRVSGFCIRSIGRYSRWYDRQICRSSPLRLMRTTTSSPKQLGRRKKYASLSSAVPRLWMQEQVIGRPAPDERQVGITTYGQSSGAFIGGILCRDLPHHKCVIDSGNSLQSSTAESVRRVAVTN
jgi:hypothetical protein